MDIINSNRFTDVHVLSFVFIFDIREHVKVHFISPEVIQKGSQHVVIKT